MDRKQIDVRRVKNHFNFEQIAGDENSLNRKVEVPNISRPGLELAGFSDHVEKKRILLIGNKEAAYINTIEDEAYLEERFAFLFTDVTPMCLVTDNNTPHPSLIKVAKKQNFPLFTTELRTSEVMVDIITYLDEKLAPTTNIHGVLMNVFGKGVLIIGESGMGKSEVALELILKGHSLIADDRVDVSRVKETIIGTAPDLIKGMLEIRGIGIIDVTRMFGVRAYLEQETVDLVIEFEKWDNNKEYLRAGIEEVLHYETLGIKIPRFVFPVKEGRNLAVLVESGVRDFMLKQRGINSAKLFDERIMEHIQSKVEEVNND
ncbi:MAG TPA: HPr(Ser) kinase/phosphatase [Erysipelothrix sp.]|nr:HPr(Ser) kinase/phosphatase [Erysipelothrix sp.]